MPLASGVVFTAVVVVAAVGWIGAAGAGDVLDSCGPGLVKEAGEEVDAKAVWLVTSRFLVLLRLELAMKNDGGRDLLCRNLTTIGYHEGEADEG